MINHMMKLSSDCQMASSSPQFGCAGANAHLHPEQTASMLVSGPERLAVTYSFQG
jgi:hypothetical protein